MEHTQYKTDPTAEFSVGAATVPQGSARAFVYDIMQCGVITITPETSGHEAIGLLVDKDISGLPVVDEMRLVGMISEKDILEIVVQSDTIPGLTSDFMTTNVVTCQEETGMADLCTCLSRHSFRHVPVMRGDKLVGIVSRSDLIRAYQNRFRPEDYGRYASGSLGPVARDVMTYGLLTVTPQTPVYRAMQMLASKEITGLPVVDDTMRLVGILSEKDIIDLLCCPQAGPMTVGELMTSDVISFQEDDCLMDICDCLATSDFRRVPILNDGKLVGIVSRRDLIIFLLKHKSFMQSRRG